jgi:hypothetical protein
VGLFLSLGNLGYGSVAGLTFCNGNAWLDNANWNILARQSDLIFLKHLEVVSK